MLDMIVAKAVDMLGVVAVGLIVAKARDLLGFMPKVVAAIAVKVVGVVTAAKVVEEEVVVTAVKVVVVEEVVVVVTAAKVVAEGVVVVTAVKVVAEVVVVTAAKVVVAAAGNADANMRTQDWLNAVKVFAVMVAAVKVLMLVEGVLKSIRKN